MERETQLTKEYLKSIGNKYDLEIIHILDLSKSGIRSLGSLPDCTNLAILDLSHNQLKSVKGIESLTKLKVLNLGYNQINSLEPLRVLLELEELNLQENKIETYQMLDPIKKLTNLQYLKLQEFGQQGQNPLCKADKYRRAMLDMFPTLFSLDGHRRHNPMIELDEKTKEILGRDKTANAGVDIKTGKGAWFKKEDMDASTVFSKAKNSGGNLIVEIEAMLRDAEKNLKEFDKLLVSDY